MDFSIVENMSDKEISEMYDENVYIGECMCYTGSKFIAFGSHLHPGFHGIEDHGYCALQLLPGDTCNRWCFGLNFTPHHFYYYAPYCTCTKGGTHTASTWNACNR